MEEQASWRGHGFTFFVFTGIVFLCGIFFVLGMLVGRTQGQKYAGAGGEGKKTASSTVKPGGELDFSNGQQEGKLPPLAVDPPGTKPDDPSEEAPPTEVAPSGPDSPGVSPPSPPQAPPPPSASVTNIQVAAYGKSSAAADLVKALKKLGFDHAFVLPPAAGDKSPLYRVQVGPYADAAEASSAKQKLEAAGYQPVLKK